MGLEFDIVIAGAGPAGLAFAASMAGTGQRIALVDPQPDTVLANPADDGREIALTDRSVALLDAAGAWGHIPPDQVAPLRRMRVLNGPSDYAMRLGAGAAGQDGLLGRFVPNHWLRRALYVAACAVSGTEVLAGRAVTGTTAGRGTAPGGATVTLSDGTALRATLVVAADTRRSPLRQQQGIGAALHDYRQRMLVCPVEHPVPHEETATAWFEYGRTLVTLPLNGGPPDGGRSSAVLTLGDAAAETLMRLDDAAFGRELERLYHGRLGTMRPVGRRQAVPVVTAYAARFVGRRFALLGDAAVGMHPTTAHGFNFAMLGQHALAKEMRLALANGGTVADPAALARYQAAHRAETGLFFAGAEALMRLYAAGDSLPARLLRDAALRVGNLPPFRQVLSGRMRNPDAAPPAATMK